MEIKVNDVSITLTDEQLAQINDEIKKRKTQITPEKRLLQMWNGCTLKLNFENSPKKVFLMKNNEVWFEQDFELNSLWCNYSLVWVVLEMEFGMNYSETQSFVKHILERHFKLGYLTPCSMQWRRD